MPKLVTTPQQTLPEIAHSVTTSDKRFTIHWPLTKPGARAITVRATGASRLSALQHRINDLLNRGHGVICPLSGKLIRIYWRGLHHSQISTLRRLMDKSDKLGVTYLHVEFFSARRDGDLAKLELWGLAEHLRAESRLEQEAAKGKWRITQRGRQFLSGQIRIPRQVAVLLGERLGYVDEADTIHVDEVADTFSKDALLDGADGKPEAEPEAACH